MRRRRRGCLVCAFAGVGALVISAGVLIGGQTFIDEKIFYSILRSKQKIESTFIPTEAAHKVETTIIRMEAADSREQFVKNFAPREQSMETPEPVLQVNRSIKVFIMFLEGRRSDRDVLMMREGIKAHPMVELIGEGPGDTEHQITAAEKADVVLFPQWGDSLLEDCGKKCPKLMESKLVPKDKLAILDFSDGPMALPWRPPDSGRIYFKRSLIHKLDGNFHRVASGCGEGKGQICFPLDYSVRPTDYAGLSPANLASDRKYSIAFLVADYGFINEGMTAQLSSARLRVRHWLLEMKRANKLPESAVIGFKGNSKAFFRKADIVVVADPAMYEGEHAIYEALGNGAVVLVGKRWIPMPHPLEDGMHVHYFDLCDTEAAREAFEKKVLSLLAQPVEEKAAFRMQGWRHALQYHQAANRIDYVVKAMLESQQPLVVPEELRVNPTKGERSYLREQCTGPFEELRRRNEWLKKNPYLKGGPPDSDAAAR